MSVGTAPMSPLANVASAAVAAKVASTTEPTGDDGPSQRNTTSSPRSGAAFRLWQRAASVSGTAGGNTARHLGFNAVEAIHELHGVSVLQLKERLDDWAARNEEANLSVCV